MNLQLESAGAPERACTGNRRSLLHLTAAALGVFLALATSTAATVHGQLFDIPLAGSCSNNGGPLVTGGKLGNLPDNSGPENTCNRGHCFPPQISLIYEPSPEDLLCNPQVSTCEIIVGADIVVPENSYQAATFTTQRTFWFVGASPPTSCPPPPACVPMAICGEWQLSQPVEEDKFRTYIKVGFSCANPGALTPATYSLLVSACYLQTCQQSATQVIEIDPTNFTQALCRPPRMDGCPTDESCAGCTGPGGGVGVGGDGPGYGDGTGPGAKLRYLARGVGSLYTPGYLTWRTTLGRNWSHDYAMRIVLDPIDLTTNHVWLLTENATFREFENPGVGGIYADRRPSDEYRQLELLPGGGWVFHELDGRTHVFDSSGRWTETRDSSISGNPKTATYDLLARLESVAMPDGRSETFSYHTNGKLASITEVGVGGTDSRLWRYSWSGDDLREIVRPDGTVLRFQYGDPRHPGYLTRVVLVAIDLAPIDNVLPPERVLRGYSYDAYGNVVQAWVGATAFASGFEKYELSYDDPELPTLTTVSVTIDATPSTSETVTYSIDRPAGETKPRITQVAGACPACGSGANSQFFFEDLGHPYLATRVLDGNGVESLFEHSAHGKITLRVDAANNPDADPSLPRETTWEYDATFPALVTAIIGPVTEGQVASRRLDFAYDGTTAALNSTSQSGLESTYPGGSFTPLTTSYSDYNVAGRAETIDPPGYGTADQATFTYDPLRGELLPLTRTDPLVGTTTFTYRPFNQVATVTDVRGLVTESFYDEMNKPSKLAVRGPDNGTETDDLITLSFYNIFGDLLCVKLPAGNGIEYGYDGAGRLNQVIRGRAVANPTRALCLETNQLRERSFWTLDVYGHRKNERLERTTTATWPATPDAETSFAYSTRCHLDKVTQAPGTAAEAVTEYDYQDCAGNLTHVWDANHPRASNAATTIYEHDALNRLQTVRQRWGGAGPATEVTTSYRHDVQDHLVGVTDGEGNETTYTFSDRDLPITENSSVSGTTSRRFNEHGQLIEETDARAVVTARSVDAADRIEFIDYAGTTLDVDYVYGDMPDPTDFTLARLKEIVRDPTGAAPVSVAYRYDMFGRMKQDGEISYLTFDANGNPLTQSLSLGLIASYTYDAMDRPLTLSVNPGSGSVSIASAATYKPRGPLASFNFGTAPARTETHSFDRRYVPSGIAVSGGTLAWTYVTDDLGNVTAIDDTLATNQDRSFGYHEFQYYLSSATGPWPGPLSWTYDRIGNRLTETRNGITDTYSYTPNGATGNTALLDSVSLAGGTGGTRDYGFGAAGHLEVLDAGANVLDFSNDLAGLLGGVTRMTDHSVSFLYDGRGFLHEAISAQPGSGGGTGDLPFLDGFESADICEWSSAVGWSGTACPIVPIESRTKFVYDSSGRLHAAVPESGDSQYLFYFGGRPIAIYTAGPLATFKYLIADHLGAPILALDSAAATLWRGGFEPFGKDYTSPSAEIAGIFLRLPGQVDDSTWTDATLGTELYYNVHRWYEQQTGRYTSSDPLVLLPGLYVYALANPLYWIDPKGLAPSCKGTWKVWDWWLLGDMRSVAPEGAPQIAPPSANSNKIPGGHSRPGGGGRGGGRDFNFIPPGVCFCSWNCKPCKGPSMFDANALPVTRGKTIHSGSDISGDFCICFNKPSIEEPCPKDPVCEVFPDLGAAVSSPDYTP